MTMLLALTLIAIYFFIYCFAYLVTPFYYESDAQKQMNEAFVPYRNQTRDDG